MFPLMETVMGFLLASIAVGLFITSAVALVKYISTPEEGE